MVKRAFERNNGSQRLAHQSLKKLRFSKDWGGGGSALHLLKGGQSSPAPPPCRAHLRTREFSFLAETDDRHIFREGDRAANRATRQERKESREKERGRQRRKTKRKKQSAKEHRSKDAKPTGKEHESQRGLTNEAAHQQKRKVEDKEQTK